MKEATGYDNRISCNRPDVPIILIREFSARRDVTGSCWKWLKLAYVRLIKYVQLSYIKLDRVKMTLV